jgi:hypothetical protein
MSDLRDVRRSLEERLRSSGTEPTAARRMAEESVRRVADRKDRGDDKREKSR